MKIPIENEMKSFTHNGVKVKPMTAQEAMSLNKGDVIKYIGPVGKTAYHCYGRRAIRLDSRPVVASTAKGTVMLKIDSAYGVLSNVHYSWALIERGDPDAVEVARAKRLLPVNLEAFRRDAIRLQERAKNRIDKSVEDIPLHKKLEVFSSMSPKDQLLYDFLYKDFDIVLGLKEEEKDET